MEYFGKYLLGIVDEIEDICREIFDENSCYIIGVFVFRGIFSELNVLGNVIKYFFG